MDIIKQLESGVVSTSIEETFAYAKALSEELPENVVIALHGDLGSGKTTLVKGLAKAWGITQTVTSPTYNFLSIYRGKRNLFHLDAYRLNSTDVPESLLLDDLLEPPYCLAIEWPNKLGDELPDDGWHLYLEIVGENQHQIKLKRS